MRPSRILQLPSGILALLPLFAASVSSERRGPHNFPAHIENTPQDEIHFKRDLQIQARFAAQAPQAVRKMSIDEGEKFYLDYWAFDEDESALHNNSLSLNAIPPLRPLDGPTKSQDFFRRLTIRNLLGKRDFQCPSGTRSCTSIDRPNSCCAPADACIIVQDTGLGDVGCCPAGSTCGGQIADGCDTDSGFTSCPNSPNGGCCIPGFACQDVGCVAINTQFVTQQPPRPTSTIPPPPPSSAAPTSNPLTSAPPSSNPPPTSAATAAPPVRPTGNTGSSLITSAPPSSTPQACPTGFYQCSAVYRGGCCRVDRDCDSTSCPATNTNILESNGVTIAAPPGVTVAAAATGSCANGWYSCGAAEGGGCCPSGFGCGEQSCTATGTASGSAVGKIAPSAGVAVGSGVVWNSWLVMGMGWAMGILMVVL